MNTNFSANLYRNLDIANCCVEKLNLNLNGMVVLTECASQAYSLTPIIAAIAGANVLAYGKDSKYGKFKDNKDFIEKTKDIAGVKGSISFLNEEIPNSLCKEVDIVTNSGMLRPFNERLISKLKPGAILCLMWETWEFRDGEIDLVACEKYGIPVIGTNERFKSINMYSYPGMMCLKLLFEMGLEVSNNTFILLGEGLTGSLIAKTFRDLDLDFDWYVESTNKYAMEGKCYSYKNLDQIFKKDRIDAIICADHVSKSNIVGTNNLVDFSSIAEKFPHLKWAHITGPINENELKASGIEFLPKKIMPVGYMSYETHLLGWEPVIRLNTGGLKVGEIARKAKMQGSSDEEAVLKTVEYGIGQSF